MSQKEIQDLEKELWHGFQRLQKLRSEQAGTPVKNYEFATRYGTESLLDLFANKSFLILIHNMGQGCRYCTTWADGINAFLPHLEDTFAVALASKDPPELQRRFANERGWRFHIVSHAGTAYIEEQCVSGSNTPGSNQPGIVCYERKGDQVYRKNASAFGPGDEFCSLWNILSLAGYSSDNWTPQFGYWKRPKTLEDGGKDLR